MRNPDMMNYDQTEGIRYHNDVKRYERFLAKKRKENTIKNVIKGLTILIRSNGSKTDIHIVAKQLKNLLK